MRSAYLTMTNRRGNKTIYDIISMVGRVGRPTLLASVTSPSLTKGSCLSSSFFLILKPYRFITRWMKAHYPAHQVILLTIVVSIHLVIKRYGLIFKNCLIDTSPWWGLVRPQRQIMSAYHYVINRFIAPSICRGFGYWKSEMSSPRFHQISSSQWSIICHKEGPIDRTDLVAG